MVISSRHLVETFTVQKVTPQKNTTLLNNALMIIKYNNKCDGKKLQCTTAVKDNS